MRDAIRDGSGQRIRYAERDAIGVEASGDPAGINAELVYLREQHARQTLEHDEDGHHDTTQVARVFLECVDKGVGDLVLTERSYAGGVYSDSVASISRIGTGAYEIQLADPLPSTRIGLADVTLVRAWAPLHFAITQPRPVKVRLITVASADNVQVERLVYDGATWNLEDGDIAILLYAES